MKKTKGSELVTRAILKEELKKLVTRIEFKKTERVLRQDILKVEERLEGVEEGQKGLDIKLDKIQNTLDGFVGAVEDLRKEDAAGELRLRDHEERIARLEQAA